VQLEEQTIAIRQAPKRIFLNDVFIVLRQGFCFNSKENVEF